MSTPVPGALDLQTANENAYQAQVGTMTDTQRIIRLALAVQQMTGGLRRALQAIYDEVD
jgi:hypothetical protein